MLGRRWERGWGELGVFSSRVYCSVNLSGDGLTGMTCGDMYRPEGLGLEMLKYSI